MEIKRDFIAHYHAVASKDFLGTAWVLFELNPSNSRYEEIDYGDNVFDEPRNAIGNTCCFISAKVFLEYFKENYPLKSKLLISSCNMIVAKQLSGAYKIGQGGYVEYANECLNIIEELKELGCRVKSEFNLNNKAKELAYLTKQGK